LNQAKSHFNDIYRDLHRSVIKDGLSTGEWVQETYITSLDTLISSLDSLSFEKIQANAKLFLSYHEMFSESSFHLHSEYVEMIKDLLKDRELFEEKAPIINQIKEVLEKARQHLFFQFSVSTDDLMKLTTLLSDFINKTFSDSGVEN